MGNWPDGLGPFEKLFAELHAWNELHELITSSPLLVTTERPRELGWILRPSLHEYDLFVQLLDKLLSDNITHAGLDAIGAPRTDSIGTNVGSLKRLDLLLESKGVDATHRRDVLKPLREVREARHVRVTSSSLISPTPTSSACRPIFLSA